MWSFWVGSRGDMSVRRSGSDRAPIQSGQEPDVGDSLEIVKARRVRRDAHAGNYGVCSSNRRRSRWMDGWTGGLGRERSIWPALQHHLKPALRVIPTSSCGMAFGVRSPQERWRLTPKSLVDVADFRGLGEAQTNVMRKSYTTSKVVSTRIASVV